MKEKLKIIWRSKYLSVLLVFLVLFVGMIYVFFDRPTVKSINDLTEIKGTINYIDRVLIDHKKIKKNERDSVYHIFLNEYPCKFQVSYIKINMKNVYKNYKHGDNISLDIANEHKKNLMIPNKKIRCFSLKVNDKIYLKKETGVRAFGKGYAALGFMIFAFISFLFTLRYILKNKI
jgi:hypothetical protein